MSAFTSAHPFAIGIDYMDIAQVAMQTAWQISRGEGYFIGGAVASAGAAMSCNWNSQYQMFTASGTWSAGANTRDLDAHDQMYPQQGYVRGSKTAAWSIPYSAGLRYAANQVQLPGPSFTLGRTDLGNDDVVTTDWYDLGERAALPLGEPNSGQAEWYAVQGRLQMEAYYGPYQIVTGSGFSAMAVVPYYWAIGRIRASAQIRLAGGGHLTGRPAGYYPYPPDVWRTAIFPAEMQDPALLPSGWGTWATLELPGSPDSGVGAGGGALTRIALAVDIDNFALAEMKISCLTPYKRRADL